MMQIQGLSDKTLTLDMLANSSIPSWFYQSINIEPRGTRKQKEKQQMIAQNEQKKPFWTIEQSLSRVCCSVTDLQPHLLLH